MLDVTITLAHRSSIPTCPYPKDTPIHENITAQFRMDAFNVFNYIGPGNPGNTCIDCSGAGIITGMALGQSPRQLEFSVTISF